MERIILTTGGTGGHIFPALAVAETIQKRHPQIKILFMGAEYGPESRYAKDAGLMFAGLPARGFLGRGLKIIPAAWQMMVAFVKGYKIVRDFKPDVIAGFGGYASFAPVLAAKIQKVPVVIHEQNAIMGQANKLLANWANQICISLPDTSGLVRSSKLTGNPVRAAIRKVKKNYDTEPVQPRLLIIGGSQGAHALNKFIVKNLTFLKEHNFEIRHQTGPKDLEWVRKAYSEAAMPEDWAIPFIKDMANMYTWANLTLCRAGASTIAELCAVGMPAILVPFPAAIHDHQALNAKNLVAKSAAILMPEMDLDKQSSINAIVELASDHNKLCSMSKAAFALGQNDAASLIADEIDNLCAAQ